MVTILIDKAVADLGKDMYERVAQARQDVRHFYLEDMNIEPCHACRGCEEKTYGRCVIRDDADLILPCLARSKTIVVITPIVFGGYSFQVKRALDKFPLLLDRHYYTRSGELTAGKPSGIKYYAIGVHDSLKEEEIHVFRNLILETLKITAWGGRSIVMPYEADDYEKLVREVRMP